MEEIYKGHTINSVGMPDAETRRWWSWLAVVCPPEPGRIKQLLKRPVIKKTFRAEKVAEHEGVAFAKRWIDAGKPEPQ
jgi:hypothetical protein